MEYILNFVDWMKNLFETIFGFFTGFLDKLTLAFQYIKLAGNVAYDMIDSLPDFLKVFATITIVISVLYIVLGRETGGVKE